MVLPVLVLAAGESKRFPGTINKAFVEFAYNGMLMAMWEHVLNGITLPSMAHLVIQRAHMSHLPLPVVRKGVMVIQRDKTQGQGDTLHQALDYLPADGEILVLNSDQGFKSGILNSMVQSGRINHCPVALTFRASPTEQDRWSYVDSHPWFFHAAEKNAISFYGMAGAYYFPDVRALRIALAHAVDRIRDSGWEPYISHLYDYLPGNKLSYDVPRDDLYDWGTREALDSFINRR